MKSGSKLKSTKFSAYWMITVRIIALVILGLLAMIAINYINLIISNTYIKFGIDIGIGALIYSIGAIVIIKTKR